MIKLRAVICWFLLMCVACGEEPRPGGGANGDARGCNAIGSTIVRLDPGVQIVSHCQTGQSAAVKTIGASGEAEIELFTGGMISLIGVPTTNVQVLTVYGLEPGVDITAALHPPVDPPPPAEAEVTISLPGPYAGATSYRLHSGENLRGLTDASDPTTFTCACEGTSVAAIAFAHDADGNVLASANGEVSVAGGSASLRLGAWSENVDHATFSLSNVPDLDPERPSAVTLIFGFRHGETLFEGWIDEIYPLEAGDEPEVRSPPLPRGFVDELYYTERHSWTDGTVMGLSALYRSHRSPPAEIALDVTADNLPRMSDLEFYLVPGLSFRADGDITKADMLMGSILASPVSWGFIAPPGTGPFAPPVFSGDLERFDLVPPFIAVSLTAMEADTVDGYRDFLEHGMPGVFDFGYQPNASVYRIASTILQLPE